MLNMWLLLFFFLSFFLLPSIAMSPIPVGLVSFDVRTCTWMPWHLMRKSVSMVEPLCRALFWSLMGIIAVSFGDSDVRASYGMASLGLVGTLTEGPQQQVWTVTVDSFRGKRQRQSSWTLLVIWVGERGDMLGNKCQEPAWCWVQLLMGHPLVQTPLTGAYLATCFSFQGPDSFVFQLLFILRARATHRVTVPQGASGQWTTYNAPVWGGP